MEMVLDVILIILLMATLFHALRLERALGVLKHDRSALEDMVATFNSSTQLAEQGIDRLRNSADGAGRQISRQIETATGLKNDLQFLSERCEKLADRLEFLVRSARSVEPLASSTTARSSPNGAVKILDCDRSASDDQNGLPRIFVKEVSEREDMSLRLRSKAERDLLKVLKMAR
jgi:hypothetical protein